MKKVLSLCTLAALVFSFISCQKSDVTNTTDNSNDGFKVYTIQSGAHYSDQNTPATFNGKSSLAFDVVFDSSAIYATQNPENQYDINKLYGFSDCGTPHQENSARFGWGWVNNQLQLHAYCYVNGERISQLIGSVPFHTVQHCKISVSGNTYVFQLNNSTVTMKRHCNSSNIDGYRLYPYFGGDETAPHKISIKIKE
jgi:hypothetical protein